MGGRAPPRSANAMEYVDPIQIHLINKITLHHDLEVNILIRKKDRNP